MSIESSEEGEGIRTTTKKCMKHKRKGSGRHKTHNTNRVCICVRVRAQRTVGGKRRREGIGGIGRKNTGRKKGPMQVAIYTDPMGFVLLSFLLARALHLLFVQFLLLRRRRLLLLFLLLGQSLLSICQSVCLSVCPFAQCVWTEGRGGERQEEKASVFLTATFSPSLYNGKQQASHPVHSLDLHFNHYGQSIRLPPNHKVKAIHACGSVFNLLLL
ncbi:MAG: hypothetical protein J3Q66DRAFT_206607 [Benniella sp.]|nr:MAG: hypothetical protein J3Q66DRAFT_206607 [Benniella sp.]